MNVDEEVIEINSNPERYSGIYKELAEMLGDNATIKIWKRFSGLNITFPQKLYSKEYRKEIIREKISTDADYEDSSKIKQAFSDAGVLTYTQDEIDEMLAERAEEIGYTGK